LEYAKESGDFHVPISRTLRADYTPTADDSRRVSVGINADKTGYALTAGEHLAVTLDVTGGLQAFGYTVARALRLDYLDTLISSVSTLTASGVWAYGSRTLSSFGTLLTDIISGVWSYVSRTLTGLAGAHTLTVTIRSQTTSGTLVGARVSLKDGTDTSVLDQKTTDTSGLVRVSVDTGSYRLHVGQLAGYDTLAAQSLSVSDNQGVTYYLTPHQPGAPASPGLCTVYGYVLVGNTPVTGATVTAKLVSKGAIADNVLLSIQTLTATTDANGYFELGLIRSDQVTQGEAEYKVVIVTSGVNQTVTIPNQTSVNVSTLLVPQL